MPGGRRSRHVCGGTTRCPSPPTTATTPPPPARTTRASACRCWRSAPGSATWRWEIVPRSRIWDRRWPMRWARRRWATAPASGRASVRETAAARRGASPAGPDLDRAQARRRRAGRRRDPRADRLLYALRDATATVESSPLIASSILSKKSAEGTDGLLMDVKGGRGAFLPEKARARALARTLVQLGSRAGLRVVALLTAMDQPIGQAIGTACELAEAIDVLRGGRPADPRALTVRFGAEMLVLGKRARAVAEGQRAMEAAIGSGAGLEQLRACVRLQGGD